MKKRPSARKVTPFPKRVVALLNALCHANDDQRRALLRAADKPLVNCICECSLNILRGIVSVKSNIKTRLKKYKNILRRLATDRRARTSHSRGRVSVDNWKAKKRIILQKGRGAFLPLLLAPIIGSLLSRVFGKSSAEDS